jgi:hypothetical protein
MKSSKPPPKDSSHLVNIDDMLERENEIFEEQQLARRKEQSTTRARRRTIEDEGGEPALDSDSDQSGMDDSEAREMEREKRAGSPDALLQREGTSPLYPPSPQSTLTNDLHYRGWTRPIDAVPLL